MEPYRPSNGSEGLWFTGKWCDNCQRRALDPGAKTQCVHEGRAFCGKDNGKWFTIDGVPTCIAFKDKKDRNRYRKKSKADKYQMELF